MSGTRARCPMCGKGVAANALRCPDCGASVAPHVERIRCNYCGRRIPVASSPCPYCRHDPRRLYLTPRWLFVGGLLVAACLVSYTALNAPGWYAALALRPTAVPSATEAPSPTAVGQVVMTATLEPSATSSATATSAPTIATPTVRPSPTGTNTPRPTPLPSPVPKPRNSSPVPTVPFFPPPLLQTPSNGSTIRGIKLPLQLSFLPQSPLPSGGWFQVQVLFADRSNIPFTWCGYTQTSSIVFPSDYWDNSWQMDRTFQWRVRVITSNASPPSTCAALYQSLSSFSPLWTFYWR